MPFPSSTPGHTEAAKQIKRITKAFFTKPYQDMPKLIQLLVFPFHYAILYAAYFTLFGYRSTITPGELKLALAMAAITLIGWILYVKIRYRYSEHKHKEKQQEIEEKQAEYEQYMNDDDTDHGDYF